VRTLVTEARRIVVKVGSSSLTRPVAGRGGRGSGERGLDTARVDALAALLADLRVQDRQVVLVSSGAIAAGLGPLGLARRPRDLATLQAAASVGQGLLVQRYADAFASHGLTVGQVLLTAEDVIRRAHYRNARRTLERLLSLGVLPVVNENDAVATEEIRFGDNDRLAALVAHLAGADLLVLLSDVDGVYDADPRRDPTARRIPEVRSGDDLAGVSTRGAGSAVGTGGMATKLEAARIATSAGVACVVGAADDAAALLAGKDAGTIFHPTGPRSSARLLWLAHASTPAGSLRLDAGAVRAVVGRRLSLLPIGVTAVAGSFNAGDPVDLVDPAGRPVARGLVNYDADEVPALLGKQTAQLPPDSRRELVHRDDLVLLPT
jgi:glutamate 5-kinase